MSIPILSEIHPVMKLCQQKAQMSTCPRNKFVQNFLPVHPVVISV